MTEHLYTALKTHRHLIVSDIDEALLLARTDPAKALKQLFLAAMGLKWVASRVMGEVLARRVSKT